MQAVVQGGPLPRWLWDVLVKGVECDPAVWKDTLRAKNKEIWGQKASGALLQGPEVEPGAAMACGAGRPRKS